MQQFIRAVFLSYLMAMYYDIPSFASKEEEEKTLMYLKSDFKLGVLWEKLFY